MERPIPRPATPEDAEAVVALARLAWTPIFEEYRRRLGDELFMLFYPTALSDKEAQVRAAIDTGTLYVTMVEGRLAAFITVTFDKKAMVGRISNNAVHPDLRGQGLAGVQYAFAKEHLRALGAKAVAVMTGLDDAHAPARRAYEKAGFEKTLPNVTYFQTL
ncbi:MAG: GNAT family N-acetyltransferase [Clostridia bacterium]|nr:GNAT family N-acetyltransferase [Clostridia bacterium]